MSPAAVMVYVDFDADAENRISLAAQIAARFDAALIGIAGWPLRAGDALPSEVEFPPSDKLRQDSIIKQLELLGQRFRKSAVGVAKGVEWRSSAHFPREFIVEQARAADLVIIGQDALPGDIYRTYDPGTIVLSSGRPVLVVPHGMRQLQSSSVMIAWKNTREARRAVHDSLPFLKAAATVHIAAVCSADEALDVEDQIADVARYLDRHGIAKAVRHVEPAQGRDEGDLLLACAREYQAGLIVTGGYGRTRLSEWIFGGVTRHLLRHSAIPCLFSN